MLNQQPQRNKLFLTRLLVCSVWLFSLGQSNPITTYLLIRIEGAGASLPLFFSNFNYEVKISMYCLKKQNNHKEDGQSMLEFILVLPVFLLLLAMIIDFGWLFFNMNNVQAAARNAGRVACVEYKDTCFNETNGGEWEYLSSKEYLIKDYSGKEDSYTLQEQNILNQVTGALGDNKDTTKVVVSYSGGAELEDRLDGDVTVAVTYRINSIVGLISIGQDGNYRDFTAVSTFKLEKNG